MHTYTQPITPSQALSRTANILNNSINPKTNRGGIATLCHICVLLLVAGKRTGKGGCSWKVATLRRSFQKHYWAWMQLEPICNVSNVIFPINKNILLESLRPGSGAFWFRNGSYRGYENEWTERSVWDFLNKGDQTDLLATRKEQRNHESTHSVCVCVCVQVCSVNSDTLNHWPDVVWCYTPGRDYKDERGLTQPTPLCWTTRELLDSNTQRSLISAQRENTLIDATKKIYYVTTWHFSLYDERWSFMFLHPWCMLNRHVNISINMFALQ